MLIRDVGAFFHLKLYRYIISPLIFHVFIAVNNIPNILQHYIACFNISRLRADCAEKSDGWVQTQNWQTTAILGSGFSAASGNREITQIRRITPIYTWATLLPITGPKISESNQIALHPGLPEFSS